MKITYVIAIAVIIIVSINSLPIAYSQEPNEQVKIFLWEDKNVSYRTLDNFVLETDAIAKWIINDENLFNHRIGDLKRAEARLNDIIPPAIHAQIASYRKDDLFVKGKGDRFVKDVHANEIINHFEKWTLKFGIKVIDLKISTSGV